MRWLSFLFPLAVAVMFVVERADLAENRTGLAIVGGLAVIACALAALGWRNAHAGPARPGLFLMCWILAALAGLRFVNQIAWLAAHSTIDRDAMDVWLNGAMAVLFALAGISVSRRR